MYCTCYRITKQLKWKLQKKDDEIEELKKKLKKKKAVSSKLLMFFETIQEKFCDIW